MAGNMDNGGRRGNTWRVAAWSAAACLWLLPLVAMQFTDDAKWDAFDFVFFGTLLLGVGSAFELAMRKARSAAYRWAAGIGLAAAFLLVWSNAAAGINDRADWVYGGVLLVGGAAAVMARFRPGGMSYALIATAVAQMSIAAASLAAGIVAAHNSAAEILGINGFFAALWLTSAWFFRKAARGEPGRAPA